MIHALSLQSPEWFFLWLSPQVFFAISRYVTVSVMTNPPSLILHSSCTVLLFLKIILPYQMLSFLTIWIFSSIVCNFKYDKVQDLRTFLKLRNRFFTPVLLTWSIIYVFELCQVSSVLLETLRDFHFYSLFFTCYHDTQSLRQYLIFKYLTRFPWQVPHANLLFIDK